MLWLRRLLHKSKMETYCCQQLLCFRTDGGTKQRRLVRSVNKWKGTKLLGVRI
jgi:hypothetical protein